MEKFIVAAETALRISDSQQGDTTLVLLHGYLESLEVWEDFTKLLTPYYRVIAMTFPVTASRRCGARCIAWSSWPMC